MITYERTTTTPDDTGADCAAFDRVEHLARQMCAESGGEWERKGTKRAMWSARAAEQLAASRPSRRDALLGDDPPVFSIAGACLCIGAGAGWLMAAWVLS